MTLPETLLTACIPAAFSGLFGYLTARLQFRRKPEEAADQIASGFSRLVDQLQEENTAHRAAIKDLQGEADKMRRGLTKLRSYAEALFRHIAVLEHQIIGLGAVPAPRPALPDTA